MAENTETLGEFQIKLAAIGGEKVVEELAKIKDSMQKLKSDAQTMFQDLRRDATNANALVATSVSAAHGNQNLGVDTKPLATIDNASKKQNRDKRSDEGDKTKKGIWELLKSWKESSSKERANIIRGISTKTRLLDGVGIPGMEKLSEGLESLSGLVRGFGNLGYALFALKGAKAWWEKDVEQSGKGKSQWYELSRLRMHDRAFEISDESMQKMVKLLKYNNRVLDEDGNIDVKATEQAAIQSARSTSAGLSTDLAMFHTRGQVPQWMRAMWMAGLETSSLEGISDPTELMVALQKKLINAKQSLGRNEYLTLLQEGGFSKEIVDAANENDTVEQLEARQKEDALIYSSVNQHDIDKSGENSRNTYLWQRPLHKKNAYESQTSRRIALRELSKLRDSLPKEVEAWIAELSDKWTLADTEASNVIKDNLSDEAREKFKELHNRVTQMSPEERRGFIAEASQLMDSAESSSNGSMSLPSEEEAGEYGRYGSFMNVGKAVLEEINAAKLNVEEANASAAELLESKKIASEALDTGTINSNEAVLASCDMKNLQAASASIDELTIGKLYGLEGEGETPQFLAPTLPGYLNDGMKVIDGEKALESVDKITEQVTNNTYNTMNNNLGPINVTVQVTNNVENTGNPEDLIKSIEDVVELKVPGLVRSATVSAINDAYNRVLEDSKYVSE